jgi:cytidyltransferase-like protein
VGRIKNQYTIPGPQRVRHQEYQIEKDTKTITTRYSERRRRMKKEKVVIVSGYFDPLHVGHLEYLQMASQLGDTLLVIINNDEQAKLKKGESFMSEKDRMEILFALECVDEVLISCDNDASVCKSIELAAQFKPMADLIFAKGGDRNFGEVPEVDVCEKLGIEMVDNLGEKIRSSSEYTGLKQI